MGGKWSDEGTEDALKFIQFINISRSELVPFSVFSSLYFVATVALKSLNLTLAAPFRNASKMRVDGH